MPLVVVVLNSLRTNEEIAQTSMIGWPQHWAWGNYAHGLERLLHRRDLRRHPALHAELRARDDSRRRSSPPCSARSPATPFRSGVFAAINWIYGIVTLGIFLPQQMRLLPWTIVLRDIGLINTLAGLVLIHTIQGLSFTTLFCRNYYVAIPQELIRAARIDGAGFFRIFWRIILPLSPPILIVTVIWQFTHIWNEFLYGVTFTTGQQQPVTAALIALSAAVADIPQHGVQSAAVMIAALPTLLVYLFGGRYFVRGLTAGAVK